jgi:benzoate-CoA ligase
MCRRQIMSDHGSEDKVYLPEHINMASYFLDENISAGRGERVAVYHRGQGYKFRDICALTNRVGTVLKELGVEPENRVLLALQDSPEWVASWFGAIKIGGVATNAYTYLQPSEYEYFISYVRPKVVVVDHTTLDRVREGAKHARHLRALLVAGEPPSTLQTGEYNFHSMVKSAGDYLEAEPTHKDDIALWNFSGGTTGKPKGVPHMHHDPIVGFESFQQIIHYTEDDVVLNVPKLFFHYVHDAGLFGPLRVGAAVALFPERSTAELIFELVEKYQPTILVNVPTMMRSMLETPSEKRTDMSSLRLCIAGGESLSPQLYNEWKEAFGVEIVEVIGSAEATMTYICNRPGEKVPGSVGRAVPFVKLKIVDEEGRELPKGQPGTLMLQTDASGRGYYRDHEKSKRTFLGNDWINTGDLFREDEAGNFYFLGRSGETVKVSGVWVSLLEIERRLQEHPAVRECVVLGVKDSDGLIKSKAFVALHDGIGASGQMADELKQFCKSKLASHKYPRVIEFLSELPKTGQGKINRGQLQERGI